MTNIISSARLEDQNKERILNNPVFLKDKKLLEKAAELMQVYSTFNINGCKKLCEDLAIPDDDEYEELSKILENPQSSVNSEMGKAAKIFQKEGLSLIGLVNSEKKKREFRKKVIETIKRNPKKWAIEEWIFETFPGLDDYSEAEIVVHQSFIKWPRSRSEWFDQEGKNFYSMSFFSSKQQNELRQILQTSSSWKNLPTKKRSYKLKTEWIKEAEKLPPKKPTKVSWLSSLTIAGLFLAVSGGVIWYLFRKKKLTNLSN